MGSNYRQSRSKGLGCGRSLAVIAGSNPAGGMDVCLLGLFVFLGIGLCVVLIACPGESNRVWCV